MNFEAFDAEYLSNMCMCLQSADMVVDTYDQYRQDSVKTRERIRRGDPGCQGQQYQVIPGRPVLPWNQFLCVAANKVSLARFLGSYITQNGPKHDGLNDETENLLSRTI